LFFDVLSAPLISRSLTKSVLWAWTARCNGVQPY